MVNKQLASNLVEIGNIRVDFTAGSLLVDGVETIVEPKVIKVLQILVEYSGEIVSQEEIFERVWPRSIYSPSSIQRCIAVLRKAMNDDAKTQSVIKTHPKRGYSLVQKVKQVQKVQQVQEEPSHASTKQSDNSIEQNQFDNLSSKSPASLVLYASIVSAVLLIIIVSWYIFNQQEDETRAISVQLSPLSASEQNDYQPKFSPQGQFLAYLKSSADVRGQLWLQGQDNLQHQSVTPAEIEVISYDWSLDGQSMLLLVRDTNQFKVIRLQIHSAAVADTSQSIQIFKLHPLVTLGNVITAFDLQWDGQSTIYYIAEREGGVEIIKHQLVSDSTEVIAVEHGFVPYTLAISNDKTRLVIMQDDNQSTSHLVTLDLDTNKQKRISGLGSGTYEVDWLSQEEGAEKWLVNSGEALFFIDHEGRQQPIGFHSLSQIEDAHVNFQGKIALTLTAYDKDIWLYDTQTQLEQILINSSLQESSARLSNSGEQTAFISERSGFPQVFIKQGLLATSTEVMVFSNESRASKISWPQWSQNDQQLWFAVDGKMASLAIDTKVLSFLDLEAVERVVQITEVLEKTVTLIHQSNGALQYAIYNRQTKKVDFIAKIPNQQAIGVMKNGKLYAMRLNKFYLKHEQDWQLIHDTQSDYVSMDIACKHGFVYTATLGNRTELRHFDLKNQETKTLQTYPSSEVILMSVSADESKILLRKQQQESDIVLLELR
jgi:transcriptional activator of cad operon